MVRLPRSPKVLATQFKGRAKAKRLGAEVSIMEIEVIMIKLLLPSMLRQQVQNLSKYAE
jgi:hypothetical protein